MAWKTEAIRSRALLLVAAPCTVLGPMPALAQSQAQMASPVGEIVVTARRRDENLARVPVAVNIVSADTISRQNLSSVQAIQYLTPSLSVTTNSNRSSNNYTLRGQGTTFGTDPSVVAYFSEVPIPGGGAGNAALFDITSVQVLNGPQGTLFGRNSVGGAILFTPTRPINRLEGSVKLGVGNYNNLQQEAIFNVPLIGDKLILRLAMFNRTRDGFTRDVANGRDYDDINARAGRLSLLFKPNGAIENLFVLNYRRSKENGTGTTISLVNPAGPAAAIFPEVVDIAAAQALRGPRRTEQTPDVNDYQRLVQFINTTTVKLSDAIALKNIVSYSMYRTNIRLDVSGTALPLLYFAYSPGWGGGGQSTNEPATNQFTEELQLSGDVGNKTLQWTAGGYYQHKAPLHTLQKQIVFGGPPVLADRGDRLTSTAVYGQGTIDIGKLIATLEGLRLTGGYRYSHDRRRDYTDTYLQVGDFFTSGGACALTAGSFPNCRIDYARNFSAGTYTGALEYQVNRSLMIYATARSGFKSGGFNLGAPPVASLNSFDPEKVKDVEIGAKSSFNVGKVGMLFNIDVFRDKYSDVQRPLLVSTPSGVSVYVVNATSATIKGVEMQARVRLPVGLSLSGTYSYNHSKYGSFNTAQGNFTGFPLPYTPKNKLSLSADYDTDLGANRGSLKLGATYTYQSSYRNLDVFDPDVRVPGYGLLNLNAGWYGVMGSAFDLSTFVTNLTNKTYIVGKGDYYYSLGFTTNVYGEPRMYGASLTYHFGDR